ncbi:MAG: sodium-dependent transporter [Clostridia bacterium]|nr:sodium-dependent transporter [Clostridia bacterium]
MEREKFRSRLGFLLVSAGCAIGIGNVWKFPYIAGENGGGVFVLIYLIFLVIMGIPVLTMELAMGRASRQSAVLAYKKLEPKNSKWHIHGWVSIAGCYLLMMYYTTVSGWMVDYCYKFAVGQFEGVSPEASDSVFTNMLKDPVELLIFMGITVVLGFLVCSGGVKKGVERITKIMMICLLVLIVVLAVHSLTLKGAGDGLKFYLLPDFSRASAAGWGNVISAAMNQAFFTLSLGIAAMEIFGSYMSKDNTLVSESVRITGLDTFVAIMSGLIIFPACFSYGVEPGQGPALIFMTLPRIFINMPLGRVWGTLFFLFMSFASLSTVTAVFENIISSSIDNFKWTRRKSVLINFVVLFVLSIPCLLGYNLLSDVHLIAGKDILDTEDFIVSNILLPLGSLIYVVFCTTKFGWGFDKYAEEVNTGKGIKLWRGLKYYFKFVLPIIILVILVNGFIGK